jgi:phosphohistidine phosphatase
MAKTLWLLRHAKTVEHPPPGGRDRDRRLAPRGERDAEGLGKAIRSGSFVYRPPEYVVVSFAARAQSTAKRVFHAVEPVVPLATDRRLYHATPDDVLEIIREFPDDLESVGIVGHNPTIQCLSLDLAIESSASSPHPGSSHYPPGTLTILQLPVTEWSQTVWGEGTLRLFRIPPRDNEADKIS